MEKVKTFKDIFTFNLLKLNDEGRFISFRRNEDAYTDVTESILNKPIISIGLKSQYLYLEGDGFKASPIKQQFTKDEKEMYKAKAGKNRRYRMIYLPTVKVTYIMTYGNGIGESFYMAGVGISDAFKITNIERRSTVHRKSNKIGVKFYAPVIEKLNIRDISLDEKDRATIQELRTYFEPYKPATKPATETTAEVATTDEVPF